MLPHAAGMNGELAGAAGAAAYAAGLHNMSPQMSAAAAAAVAAYGRSPMVSEKDLCFGKVTFHICVHPSVASPKIKKASAKYQLIISSLLYVRCLFLFFIYY